MGLEFNIKVDTAVRDDVSIHDSFITESKLLNKKSR